MDKPLRGSQSFGKFFLNLDYDIENNKNLRDPQREGYLRVQEHLAAGKNNAIVQIPVGCGKSGLAAILPLGIAEGRVIVIAPNLTIKDGLYEAMDITNRQKCFWRKAGVLEPNQMIEGPLTSTLDSGNISVASKSHIVVTNVHQLATNADKWLTQFSDNFFDMIIIDEAHHAEAESWKKVVNRFPNAKVILLTATPFRSDRQKLKGKPVFRYPFRSATLKGYIKRLKASYVAPSTIELGFSDQSNRTYTLEEVLEIKEEDWFSRGVALARICNQHIVDNSLEKLEELRQSGTQHQLIAVACTIDHAKEIRSMYSERRFSAEVIHSKQRTDEQDKILAALKNGTFDCIVQVQMLGEGFDHPKLSVAAIFRPFRTLAPYIQFVGRIMRVVVQNDPAHPDNVGHIVTHLGMNLDERLKEFKEFENDDQAFWDKVIGGEEPETPASVREGSTRLRVGEHVVVHSEIVDSLWEEDFTTFEDEQVIADIRQQFALLGLDPSQAEETFKRAQLSSMRKKNSSEPFLVQPQKEWEEVRKRLNEQGKRLAGIVLNNVDLKTTGREIPHRYRSLNVSGTNNFVSVLKLVNHEINKRLGKSREDASTEEIKTVLAGLDEILKFIDKRVRKAKSEYERRKT